MPHFTAIPVTALLLSAIVIPVAGSAATGRGHHKPAHHTSVQPIDRHRASKARVRAHSARLTTPAPPTISGTTYYVSPSGSDSNSGTSAAHAWKTVDQVNRAQLNPGDGVLFAGGATFSDNTLMPASSGGADKPIVYGSYGQGKAILTEGVWFRGHSDLAFENLTISSPGQGINGTGDQVTIDRCSIHNVTLGIQSHGLHWTIENNIIDHTSDSGLLLYGDTHLVTGNTITDTGLDNTISYGKHGIYLKAPNSTIANNAISNFSADGVSVRYRNSTISNNRIANGPIGIAWFQYDTITATSHFTANAITNTTEAGIYVSPSDSGGNTRENFVIQSNTITTLSGVSLNLHPTTGTYTVRLNARL